jgi:hypothetical protein
LTEQKTADGTESGQETEDWEAAAGYGTSAMEGSYRLYLLNEFVNAVNIK